MTAIPQKTRFTPAEYYLREQKAEFKSDYYTGEIFAMAEGTIRHCQICTNLIREVGNRLKGTPCWAFESNLRLAIKASGLRCHPDVTVFCGQFEKDIEDPTDETVTNPTVIFEVLSPSTEAYDRGLKAESFRQITSLRSYVFVSQSNAHIEWYLRQPDGSWLFREVKGLDESLSIPDIKDRASAEGSFRSRGVSDRTVTRLVIPHPPSR